MSKKLLIAVLTLGLMFALSGVASAFDDGTSREVNQPVPRNPNAPQLSLSSDQDERSQSQQFNRPLEATMLRAATPTRVWPPDAYCADTNYLYPAGTFYYTWWEPEYYYGPPMTYNNMRFTSAAGYYCTLVSASIGLEPADFGGAPDLDVIVWDDDGFGSPDLTKERGRVTVLNADLITSTGWQTVDLRPLGIVYEGEHEFHVGIACPNEAGGTNWISMYSDGGIDHGGFNTGRLSFLWQGNWYHWTKAYNYAINVEMCTADIPYSSCDFRKYFNIIDDWWYVWRIPNGYPIDYYNTRFTAAGPETIKAIGYAIFQGGPTSSNHTTGPLAAYIWGGAAGFPDLSNVIYQTEIQLADMSFVNQTGDSTEVDLSAENLVIRGDYFIGYMPAVAGDTVTVCSDNGSFGPRTSSGRYPAGTGNFYIMGDIFTLDFGFIIYSRTCKDEFSLCQSMMNASNAAGATTLPNGTLSTSIVGMFQGFESIALGCRLDTVKLAFQAGTVDQYTYNSEVYLFDEDLNVLGMVTLTPADYKFWPEWTVVDVNAFNARFNGVIYAGVYSLAPDPAHGIILIQENPYTGGVGSIYTTIGGSWYASVRNRVIQAEVCCIPPPERTCTPGEDWPTCAHDFRRSAASFNSTGDAKCKQAVAWQYYDAAGFFFNRPVIYDGVLLVAYNTKLMAFDVDDGTPLYTISGMPYIGTGFRNTVTVKDGYVYFGGGNAANITKADVYTGAIQWSTAVGGFNGNVTYTSFVILDVGGQDIIFFGTSEGRVYARKCSDGTAFTGWTVNPRIVGGDTWTTLSSNGTDVIYVADDGKFGRGYGSINAFNAATGAVLWTLDETSLAGIALDGDTLGTVTLEIFQGPIAVDEYGYLYVMSSFASEMAGAPSGVRYRISKDGDIIWAVNGKWQGTTSTVQGFTSPVIDANAVYCQSLRGWTSETTGIEAVDKYTAEVIWTADAFWTTSGYVEGALSCEPLVADVLYIANNGAQFLALDADYGTVLFKYDYSAPSSSSVRGCGTAIDPTHVVFTNRRGDVFVMTEQVDRPRLNILLFDELRSVPFFSPDNFLVRFEDAFENMGCVNLTGTLTANSTAASEFVVSSVNPRRVNRMSAVADQMVDNSYKDMARKVMPVKENFEESGYSKDSYSNMSAYLPPTWFIAFQPATFNIEPGGTFDIAYTVHGDQVTRGPHYCYITIASNDQFFLNAPTANPVIQLGVIGGCLEADDEMVFGTTDQNVAPITSTSEMGNQDQTLWDIDGADAWYWQGGLVFGMSQRRLAFNLEGWSSADANNLWNLTLPDINCFNQCEPYVTPDLRTLGAISHDGGLSYDAVRGYIATNRWIDSLLQLDCGGTWNWKAVTCPFSNDSTMGLIADQTIYGVSGEPALNNVIIYRTDITERNGRALPNVYFGAIQDYDLENNGFDVARFDAAHSIGWSASCYGVDIGNTVVAGMGKIPMDISPMIGVRTLDANQAMWSTNSAAGLDSMYLWMSTNPGPFHTGGASYQAGVDMEFPCGSGTADGDREQFFSLVGHSFTANETYTFGYYQFAFNGADANDPTIYANLAIIVNQFAGFGRGDINGDNKVNLVDVVALWNMLHASGNGPLFQHLADVNNDSAVDDGDVLYLANYWFCAGPAPIGDWVLPLICP